MSEPITIRQKEIELSFEKNRLKWLKDNNFNENEETYVITGETYSIKDILKDAGFRYHPILGWHKSTPDAPEEYKNRLICVNLNDIAEKSAWGEYHFYSDAKKRIHKNAEAPSNDTHNWIGEKGSWLPAVKIQLIKSGTFNSRYGIQNIYTFETIDKEALLVWFTSSIVPIKKDEYATIRCKVKEHKLYNDIKQTIVSNVKFFYDEEENII